jgi:hypothetical protein
MGQIRAAQIVAFYLFDVAESADLAAIPPLVGGQSVAARLAPKPPTPAYVQYDKPPVSFDGEALGLPEIDGFRTRVRVYDYGVVSIALQQPFGGSWSALAEQSQQLIESPDLERRAAQLAHQVTERLRPALTSCRDQFLTEDYIVFAVHELDTPLTAEALLEAHGADIAALLRGERQTLSAQERTKVLAHQISYLANDLVVPTWNAALVYDTPAGAQAALEIMEFANSQLLELRHYDQLLDRELEQIYQSLKRPRPMDQWFGSRYTKAAREVHALFIDVNELTDRTENALKFIGDIYAVQLFRLVGDRLGLETWKADVEAKLTTVDDIYRFAVEQHGIARGNFLELTIIMILVFELVLVLMGIME